MPWTPFDTPPFGASRARARADAASPVGSGVRAPRVNRRRGFILLEVTVAVVILGISASVAMRSFILSMHATRELEIAMRASLLAQAMIGSWELTPPSEGRLEGSFGEDPNYGNEYRYYFFRMQVEEERVDYRDVSLEGMRREFQNLTKVRLEIYYDDQRNRRFRPLDLTTYVIELDPFSPQARQANQLP